MGDGLNKNMLVFAAAFWLATKFGPLKSILLDFKKGKELEEMPRPKLKMVITEPVPGLCLLTSWPRGQTRVWATPGQGYGNHYLTKGGKIRKYFSPGKRKPILEEYTILGNRSKYDVEQLYCDPNDAIWVVESSQVEF